MDKNTFKIQKAVFLRYLNLIKKSDYYGIFLVNKLEARSYNFSKTEQNHYLLRQKR